MTSNPAFALCKTLKTHFSAEDYSFPATQRLPANCDLRSTKTQKMSKDMTGWTKRSQRRWKSREKLRAAKEKVELAEVVVPEETLPTTQDIGIPAERPESPDAYEGPPSPEPEDDPLILYASEEEDFNMSPPPLFPRKLPKMEPDSPSETGRPRWRKIVPAGKDYDAPIRKMKEMAPIYGHPFRPRKLTRFHGVNPMGIVTIASCTARGWRPMEATTRGTSKGAQRVLPSKSSEYYVGIAKKERKVINLATYKRRRGSVL